MRDNRATFIITSSNRFELLERTLHSFFMLNSYPFAQYILHEDSGNKECMQRIIERFGDRLTIITQPERKGLSTALDNLLALVRTEYVFTCEDDWLFENNLSFVDDSQTILARYPHIHQVWVRAANDHHHPLGPVKEYSAIKVQEVLQGYQGVWNGFSFNPGLRRMADLKRMFPNGLREYGDEIECAKRAAQFNYRAVSLANHACRHIGYGHHTKNFKV